MKGQRFWMKTVPRLVLLTIALVTIAAACEQETVLNIFLKVNRPPSFSFSGNSLATDFEILELPRTKPLSKINPYSFTGETIWKISAATGMKADTWPGVTYGQVPDGFLQKVPSDKPPPKLYEGKLYVARISQDKNTQTGLFFEMRNGMPHNLTDKVFDR